MAAIDDLIRQIGDPALRARIAEEVGRLSKQKKFGLVFEEHLPEVTPLYEVPLKKGAMAARPEDMSRLFYVASIEGDVATCVKKGTNAKEQISVSELVTVASFGEPIYPYLKALGSVENAPDSALWHTLIEADNYHALQLLDYLYHGKVDCIYIDPPYNTGAKDWKYNNDYVDSSDAYRHSKWLSMMEKRLKLAKKLLNPQTGVLIVTIDEHEVHHLHTLLEQVLSDAYIQMVTMVINPKGSTRGRFSRVEEYALFCFMPNAYVDGGSDPMLGEKPDEESLFPRWKGLLRSGAGSRREDSKNLFYPILIDEATGTIIKACPPIEWGITPDYTAKIDGYSVAWPIKNDGTEGRWMLSTETFNSMLSKGYIALGRHDSRRHTWGLSYLSKKYQDDIESGILQIIGKSENGQTVVVKYATVQGKQVKTVWHRTAHDAGAYGSDLISSIIGRPRAFSFPKSLYVTKDALSMIVRNKPNALILDFFAGSGTTLHAVNLLNAEDGGNRRCILVTNNEVSADEAKELRKGGYKPGDDEWEQLGIARYVTWPRTVCSIEGHDVNEEPLKGTYLGSDRPMAEGFAANAAFFHLGFLDKNAVARGTQLEKLLSVLWLKAGAIGKCPEAKADDKMMVFPENRFAVLVNSQYAEEFRQELSGKQIEVAYIITDYENEYKGIADSLQVPATYQLYRDYVDNFTINTGRD